MGRIAKKPRNVKGDKRPKQPPRYTIRKDTLGRRYAIDKRNGKRVAVSKADNERTRRRAASGVSKPPKAATKAPQIFHGIKPLKPSKAPKAKSTKSQKRKRSEAAKKGWEKRRAKIIPLEVQREYIVQLGREIGAFAIPEGMRMHVVGGIADRSETYPKVKIAADDAFVKLEAEYYNRKLAMIESKPLPEATATPRFDKHHGAGMGQLIRDRLAGAMDLADIDQLIEEMSENPDYDFDTRELYTLYFSPEVA
jgi:hypothetical protein